VKRCMLTLCPRGSVSVLCSEICARHLEYRARESSAASEMLRKIDESVLLRAHFEVRVCLDGIHVQVLLLPA
jgi:hypothetical protein